MVLVDQAGITDLVQAVTARADGLEDRQIRRRLAHFIVEQEHWLAAEHAATGEHHLAQVLDQRQVRIEPVEISRHAADDGIQGDAFLGTP